MRKILFLLLILSIFSVQMRGMEDEGDLDIELFESNLKETSYKLQEDFNSLKECLNGEQSPLASDEEWVTDSEEEDEAGKKGFIVPQLSSENLRSSFSEEDFSDFENQDYGIDKLRQVLNSDEENKEASLVKFLFQKGKMELNDGLLGACTKKLKDINQFKMFLSGIQKKQKSFKKEKSKEINQGIFSLVDLVKNISIAHLQEEKRKSEEMVEAQEKSLRNKKKTIYGLTATNVFSGVLGLITVANFGFDLYNKFYGGGGCSGGCDTDI